MELPQLGDSKPSELMNTMLSYLPADVDSSSPGFLFRAIFLERMPADIRTHLVSMKTDSMTALADRADDLYSSRVVTSFLVDQESEIYILIYSKQNQISHVTQKA